MAVGDPAAFVEGKSELLIVVNSAGIFFFYFLCLFVFSLCCYDNRTANHSSTVAAVSTGTLVCSLISRCKSPPWSCSYFPNSQSLLFSLLQAGLYTACVSSTMLLIVAVWGKSIKRRTLGDSCWNF